ncbi:MAG: hypothetical protein LBH08_00930 [Puniceicoccales bacterium]|jgi:hypothetical protein|nr:hypothetical protein [Puniceicoccales bacterium]
MDKKNIVLGLLWINTLQAGHGPSTQANAEKWISRSGALESKAKSVAGPLKDARPPQLTNNDKNPKSTDSGLERRKELKMKCGDIVNSFRKRHYGDTNSADAIDKALNAVDMVMKSYPSNLQSETTISAIQAKVAIKILGILTNMKNNVSKTSATDNKKVICEKIDVVAQQYQKLTQSSALSLWIQAYAERSKAQAQIQGIMQEFLSGQYGERAQAPNLLKACSDIDNIVNAVKSKPDGKGQLLSEFAYKCKTIIRSEAIFKRFSEGKYGNSKDGKSLLNVEQDIKTLTDSLNTIESLRFKNKVIPIVTQLQKAIEVWIKADAFEEKISKGGYGDLKIPSNAKNVEQDLALIVKQVNEMPAKRWVSTSKKKVDAIEAKYKKQNSLPQQTEVEKTGT